MVTVVTPRMSLTSQVAAGSIKLTSLTQCRADQLLYLVGVDLYGTSYSGVVAVDERTSSTLSLKNAVISSVVSSSV